MFKHMSMWETYIIQSTNSNIKGKTDKQMNKQGSAEKKIIDTMPKSCMREKSSKIGSLTAQVGITVNEGDQGSQN